MLVLSLALVAVPFLPVVRDLPRWVPVYRLIWRSYYRAHPTTPRTPTTDGGVRSPSGAPAGK